MDRRREVETFESPGELISRFLDFAHHLEDENRQGGVFWRVEVDRLITSNPYIDLLLLERYESNGLVGVKARFIEELYRNTEVRNLGNVAMVLEKIILFE